MKLQLDHVLDGEMSTANAKGLEKINRLIKIYGLLSNLDSNAVHNDIVQSCVIVIKELQKFEHDRNCAKLISLLQNPYFKCLLEAHDSISCENERTTPISKKSKYALQVRMLGLTRSDNDPVGIILGKHGDGCIYIKRVLKGTMLQKQELVNVGDVVRSINGSAVPSDLEEAQQKLDSCGNNFTMQVISKNGPLKTKFQIYLKCNFDYEPKKDTTFPKSERGLSFKRNDIIEVVDQSDVDWWQACHLSEPDTVGLVPSLCYWQQKKISYSPMFYKDGLLSVDGLKKKIMYNASNNSMFDSLECQLYEEVTNMPPVDRKLIILIGADGVGKRSIKKHFIKTYPTVYGAPRPDTSRPSRDGETNSYHFVDKESMQHDIALGAYIESGENGGHLYGTRIDSVRAVINSGRTCIFDCNPTALKRLRNAEFMPYVVFIEPAPRANLAARKKHDEINRIYEENSRLKQIYHRFIDLTICNDDFENTIVVLLDNYNTVCHNSQWVPSDWVY